MFTDCSKGGTLHVFSTRRSVKTTKTRSKQPACALVCSLWIRFQMFKYLVFQGPNLQQNAGLWWSLDRKKEAYDSSHKELKQAVFKFFCLDLGGWGLDASNVVFPEQVFRFPTELQEKRPRLKKRRKTQEASSQNFERVLLLLDPAVACKIAAQPKTERNPNSAIYCFSSHAGVLVLGTLFNSIIFQV